MIQQLSEDRLGMNGRLAISDREKGNQLHFE